jgi:hypothetical protein
MPTVADAKNQTETEVQDPLVNRLQALRSQIKAKLGTSELSDLKSVEKQIVQDLASLYMQTGGRLDALSQLIADFSKSRGQKPPSWLEFPEVLLRATTLIGSILETHHAMRTQGAVLLNQAALADKEAPQRLAQALQLETAHMERFHQRLADLFICLLNAAAGLGIDVTSDIGARMVYNELVQARSVCAKNKTSELDDED